MTPLETEANPNIRVGPLRWGRPGWEVDFPIGTKVHSQMGRKIWR